jgi:MtN3 and saliva related transmembrane protein
VRVLYDRAMIDAIGFAAATLTTLSFVPQLVKTWQTRSSGDLSLGMLLAFLAGIVLWIVFGVATHTAPVIVANVATLVLASCQIGLTLRYRQRPGRSRGRVAGRTKSESTTI